MDKDNPSYYWPLDPPFFFLFSFFKFILFYYMHDETCSSSGSSKLSIFM